MNLVITNTTDNKYLGLKFQDIFPIKIGDTEFTPDYPPISLGKMTWRFYNSNYSIDAKEI